jgi:hypothetical protein
VLSTIVQFVAIWALIGQSTATTPLRTGDVARQLTEQDIAALELVLPPGGTPWLLNGDPLQLGNGQRQFIYAYLPPTTATAALRRGLVIGVMRQISPPTAWTAQADQSYAQVAIAGRNFDQIQGDQDINRPFRVFGRFDDTELVRLVDFIRSDSPARGNSIQPWPILSIIRQADDSIRVMTESRYGQGQMITLRQAGQDWVILRVRTWIA